MSIFLITWDNEENQARLNFVADTPHSAMKKLIELRRDREVSNVDLKVFE